jgi:dipeptidase E
MQIFLTSSAHTVAHDIAKSLDLEHAKKLVFIATAAEPKMGSKVWLKNDRKTLVDAGFSVSDYTISGKTKSQLEQELSGSDFIYLSGGDTSYLPRKHALSRRVLQTPSS